VLGLDVWVAMVAVLGGRSMALAVTCGQRWTYIVAPLAEV
jgi:hypothetical protein